MRSQLEKITFVLLFVHLAFAAKEVNLTCDNCGSDACITPSGDGFEHGYVYRVAGKNCSSQGNFPINYNFACSGDCSAGCFIVTF